MSQLFNIINPSDPMTMYATDLVTAAIAVVMMGRGKLGVNLVTDPEQSSPVLFGWDEWLAEQGIDDIGAWIDAHWEEVSGALESVMLGTAADRADLDSALEAITEPEKRAKFITERNDRRRSSTNDWEGYAHSLARQIKRATEGAQQ